ncbi:hypothetical protein HOE04_02800 [archaeon]|jgi:TPP-dependent pyruvate/acetoin dehydrogenase alpha subunit|nr:hypothetical protein [archaeon]
MESLTKEELIEFEDEIKELYLGAKIRSPVHFSKGNEEQLIEVFKEVNSEDWVFSTHRSHYHALLKGIPREKVLQDILDNKSIHLNSSEYNFFTSAIVGGVLPIAVGVAMGLKMKGLRDKVWVFVGDMCAEMGIFHECVKYSKRHGLGINFVIEDNGLSVETPTQDVWGCDEFDNVRVIKYKYNREYPHHGCGQWVEF